MKKFVLFSLMLVSVMFFSFNFDLNTDCGTSGSGSRNITCGSCHGGSINTDIIITDGLIGGNDEGEANFFNIEISVPTNISVSAVQTNLNSNKKGRFATLENIKPLFHDSYGVQYALMDLPDTRGGKKEVDPIVIQWYPPENFSGSQNIVVEGVFANLDGTPNGDYSFYKEITIHAKTALDEFKIYPTMVNDHINIQGINKDELIQIIDFSGRVLFNQMVENNTIFLSELPAGYYFLKAQDKVAKFLKK